MLVADVGQDLDGSFDDCVVAFPKGAAGAAEGGSPSAQSAIPEETDSDFSGHVQQVPGPGSRGVGGRR
eukprot:6231882-Pyramimonas_sp.AAC.1